MTDINPKAIEGRKKLRTQFTPVPVLNEIHKGMTEGAEKYGAFNWREVNIEMSDYYDSSMRHLTAWWEGEDIDAESGVHHISKTITGLIVLRDAMLSGTCVDDRPKQPTILGKPVRRCCGTTPSNPHKNDCHNRPPMT